MSSLKKFTLSAYQSEFKVNKELDLLRISFMENLLLVLLEYRPKR